MSASIETIAYNKVETPWHGLGNAVDGDLTPEEMLVAASLNWSVSRRLVRMRISKDSEVEIVIPGYQAIVRDSDNKVFQVASDRYKPIQNKDVLGFFDEYCKAGGMTMETAGALKGGAIIWALAKIGKDFTLAGGDKVDGYMLLCNSHDGSLSFAAMFTSVRVVCWNTLQSALNSAGKASMFRMKHSKKFTDEVAKDAKKKLGLAVAEMKALEETANYLTQTKVDPNGQLVKELVLRLVNPGLFEKVVDRSQVRMGTDGGSLLDAIVGDATEPSEGDKDAREILEHLEQGRLTEEDLGRVGRGVLNAILDSPGSDLKSAKETMWGVVNGVTYYADHQAGRERDTALQSAWFGQKADMKRDALMLARDYATGKIVTVNGRN